MPTIYMLKCGIKILFNENLYSFFTYSHKLYLLILLDLSIVFANFMSFSNMFIKL